MSFLSSMDISVAGMIAQRTRMDVIAQNVANADSTRTTEGGPYVRQCVTFSEEKNVADGEHLLDFSSILSEKLSARFNDSSFSSTQPYAGVTIREIVDDPTPPTPVYDPSHPDADEDGYYYMPNVDVTEEEIDMLAATQSYNANLTVFNVRKSIAQKALTIGQ